MADLRARGISPIRSVYANAQANLDRQRRIQGGYSPGYTAATAKMARELSDEIASKTTDVNAKIAEMQGQSKMAALSPYASMAEQEASRAADLAKSQAQLRVDAGEAEAGRLAEIARTNAEFAQQSGMFNASTALELAKMGIDISKFNTGTDLSVQEFNKNLAQRDFENKMGAIGGMRSIYGTTPALASTFGSQALSQAQLDEMRRQFDIGTAIKIPGSSFGNNYRF